jgi:murein DD-endopeptidase MepM/ murein hydrolase activator NlpD
MTNHLLIKTIIIIVSVILIAVLFLVALKFFQSKQIILNQTPIVNKIIPLAKKQPQLLAPLNFALKRITKKPFGIYITPENSPIKPEKFAGFHTGVDFEILPGEENQDVSVSAVCAGKLLLKKSATGYGGVAVESCTLNNQDVTIIYGHLKLSSISLKTGEEISAGQTIGILGKAYSTETSGERKHLHLGIHKGSAINLLGYVQNKKLLDNWLNAIDFILK